MWIAIFGWPVLGTIAGVVISVGVGFLTMTPPRFLLAQLSFSIAAIMLMLRTAWWLGFEQSQGTPIRQLILLGFLVYGFTGSLWALSLHWTNGLKSAAFETGSNTSSTATFSGPYFALSLGPFIFHNSPNGMWFGAPTPKAPTISPVGLLAGIRIVNLQRTPTLVERYSLYAWDGQEWGMLPRIDTRFGTLYLVLDGDFQHASPQHTGTQIDNELGEKPIGPHEARHGWAAFQYEPRSGGVPRRFKLIVGDVLGHEETYVHEGGQMPMDKRDSMWGEVIDVEKNADLSGWAKTMYGMR